MKVKEVVGDKGTSFYFLFPENEEDQLELDELEIRGELETWTSFGAEQGEKE